MNAGDSATVEAMTKYGGEFVQRLASALRVADPDNLARCKATWPEYWTRYSEITVKEGKK